MRLKTYTAPTMAEAMKLVRREMGENAIIVTTQRASEGQGARVTAAVEEIFTDEEALDQLREVEVPDIAETIRQALAYHGTPPRLIERLIEDAGSLDAEDPTMALAGAVDAGFSFAPLADREDAPTMLVGPPGAGKTITTAKLAARAALNGHSVAVITTDTRRAGGVEQLEAFTRILKLELERADTVDVLAQTVAAARGNDLVLIDTQGTNPFSDTELDQLDEFVKAAGAEPVLVLAAGGDAMEAADIATSFAAVGVKRLLVTRLDMARRLGGILAAADAARLAFCNVSLTPHVADGLSQINPMSLARLIMPHNAGLSTSTHLTEAAS